MKEFVENENVYYIIFVFRNFNDFLFFNYYNKYNYVYTFSRERLNINLKNDIIKKYII